MIMLHLNILSARFINQRNSQSADVIADNLMCGVQHDQV